MTIPVSPPPPTSSVRIAAIALLFKDGFPLEDLVEIFALSAANIEEHLRRAMFNKEASAKVLQAEPTPAPVQRKPRSGNLKKSLGLPKSPLAIVKGKACPKHPGATEFDKRGACRQCQRDYQKAHWLQKKAEKAVSSRTPLKRTCAKHPESPFYSNGQCAECAKSQQRVRDAKRRRKKPAADSAGRSQAPVIETPEVVSTRIRVVPAASEFVYSKPVTCPKCNTAGIRLQRRRDADLDKDHWLHVRGNGAPPCTLKISHYRIQVDKNHQPVSMAAAASA